jgi:hypothetical protein
VATDKPSGRDGIALQFNVSDPTQEPPKEGCRVCYIGVTNIEALYQQYVPTGAIRSPLQATSWGTKGFWLCDPFRNILLFLRKAFLKGRERRHEASEYGVHLELGPYNSISQGAQSSKR